MTSGFRTTSFGDPSTIFRPELMTTTRSESSITASITCSTMISVTPFSRTFRSSPIISRSSTGVRPAIASSSISRVGSVPSAIATSSRFLSAIVMSVPRKSIFSCNPANRRISTAFSRTFFRS